MCMDISTCAFTFQLVHIYESENKSDWLPCGRPVAVREVDQRRRGSRGYAPALDLDSDHVQRFFQRLQAQNRTWSLN